MADKIRRDVRIAAIKIVELRPLLYENKDEQNEALHIQIQAKYDKTYTKSDLLISLV